jgi:hypothetical protein
MSTIERPDFGDILKVCKWFFSGVNGLLVLHEFKVTPKFLGYLAGHRWGAPTVLSKK